MPRDLGTEIGRAAHRASQKKYAQENPGKLRESQHKWHERNPAKAVFYREKYANKRAADTRSWKKRNPEKVLAAKRRHDLKQYGLTSDDYEALLEVQGGHCRICPATKPGGRGRYLHVDHCHRTGKVRGLLCTKCNTAIGLLDDDPQRADAVGMYLRRNLLSRAERDPSNTADD